jgi:cytochrome P450
VKEAMDNHTASDDCPSVFHALLSPEGKDEKYVVPTVDEIKDEATTFFGAAADTTGSAMTVGTFHVVSNPEIYARLRKELEDAFPDPDTRLDYLKLEPLPYLVSLAFLFVS